MNNEQVSPYQRLGGEMGVKKLVYRFYELMDTLPQAATIRAMHPQDLSKANDKLFMFLSGWLGGPDLYQQAYGHPRLRKRHMPFPVDEAARDAWMLCMKMAVDELEVDDAILKQQLLHSLFKTADFMRNCEPSQKT